MASASLENTLDSTPRARIESQIEVPAPLAVRRHHLGEHHHTCEAPTRLSMPKSASPECRRACKRTSQWRQLRSKTRSIQPRGHVSSRKSVPPRPSRSVGIACTSSTALARRHRASPCRNRRLKRDAVHANARPNGVSFAPKRARFNPESTYRVANRSPRAPRGP